jgi:glycosyltransferase involved in cell wall biosynthesis
MRFLVYCALNSDNIEFSLGEADYSYYFVMQRFLPLLEEFGEVTLLNIPATDAMVAEYQQSDRCIYLSFAPPDKVAPVTRCPVVPVFAWEFSNIPYETFTRPRDNWVNELRAAGRAITHSGYAAGVVREQLGQDFAISSIPAPLWDSCENLREKRRRRPPRGIDGLSLDCKIIDSRDYEISNIAVRPGAVSVGKSATPLAKEWSGEPLLLSFARDDSGQTLVGFNDAENWGVWSKSGHPWILLDHTIEGEVELEITVCGYGHNVGEPLGLELGNCKACLLLSESLTTHVLTLTVDTPSNFLAFQGVGKRAVDMADPRDIGFGLASLSVRRPLPNAAAPPPVLLDFSTDGMSLQGFHGPEEMGRWTAASSCTVQMPRGVTGDIDVVIETFNVLNNEGRGIVLSVGGVSRKITLSAEQSIYEISLSGVAPTDFFRLENLGVGDSGNEKDPRKLGLGIARMSLNARPGSRNAKAKGRSKTSLSFFGKRQRSATNGVLYTAILNPNDARKNWEDIVTAFVYAFRDKPHVTLLIKITNHDLTMFFRDIFTFFMELHPFECRLVFVHGYLDWQEYEQLIAETHFIVNASRGEGQCLPLMEFMSSGVPAIAPLNTAMLDYVDESNAFVVASSPELTYWPQDPRQVFRTLWQRINWQTLHDAFRDSERAKRKNARLYQQMSEAAISSLEKFCSMNVARERLRDFIGAIDSEGGR